MNSIKSRELIYFNTYKIKIVIATSIKVIFKSEP